MSAVFIIDSSTECAWENRCAMLIGNPGISKTYFQFYIMHRDHMVNNINVVADKYNRPTILINCQTGTHGVDYYFPIQEEAFPSSCNGLNVCLYCDILIQKIQSTCLSYHVLELNQFLIGI